jgi:hypothetical protein
MPILTVKSNELNFEIIDSLDPRTIAFLDKSVYLESSPDKPMVEVLIPGSTKPIVVPFRTNEYNVITGGQLNISCGKNSTLPDGVYTLKISVCPHEYVFLSKTFLKASLLEYELDSILLKQLEHRDIPKNFKKDFEYSIRLLEAAKIHAERGNINESTNLYKKVSKIVNKLNCK